MRAAETSELVPAMVVPKKPPSSAGSSRTEIVTANGRRVVIDAGVDVAALGRVLNLLERR